MRSPIRFLIASCALFGAAEIFAADAPFIAVTSADGKVEQLPLKMTSVHVDVLGPVADVQIHQTFENRGTVPIQAVYIFPASERAAVYAMTLSVGNRRIRAQIEEKRKATERYEQAVAQGKTASLLESVDDHLFKMRVGNVLPGEEVSVELRYTELLVPEKGVYELIVPNTVSKRYEQAGSMDLSGATTRDPNVIDYAFNFDADLRPGLPIAEIISPSHQIEVLRDGLVAAKVILAGDSIKTAAGADLRLQFRLSGGAIRTGLSLYPQGEGGYFLLQLEPPSRVLATDIPPREFIFVVDVSGSMSGPPLDVAKTLMRRLLDSLGPQDYLNVLLFAGGSDLLSTTSLPANAKSLGRAQAFVTDQAKAFGGTELVDAMQRALAIPRAGVARSVIVITDGVIAADAELMRSIRAGVGDSNVFALGVGPSVARDVIARIARAGGGEPFIIEDLGASTGVVERLRDYIDRPLLTRVKVSGENFNIFDLDPEPVPDLMAERPLTVVGRYRGAPTGAILVQARAAQGAFNQRVDVASATHLPDGNALRLLWARRQLARATDDYDAGFEQATRDAMAARMLSLGLEHGLLSPFTAFVAVDDRVRTSAQAIEVEQPAVANELGWSMTTGSTLTTASALRVGAQQSVAAIGCPESRRVGEREYCLQGAVWTDAELKPDARRLRIRRDSPAMQWLLQQWPGLTEALALGERVVIRIGDWAIDIGPSGFSDISEDMWTRIRDSGSG